MESNVMYLYVYKENPIKSFEPKMLRSTFLVRFHWILWNISVNIIRHGVCVCVCVFSKVGKSGLNINQQWAMTAHISCQTLSKCRLNARLFSPLRFVPSCFCILCYTQFFHCCRLLDYDYCLVMLLLIPRLTFWIEKIRQRYNGSYLPFVIFMWLSYKYTQCIWKLSENKNYCELPSRSRKLWMLDTLKMTMTTDFYFPLFYNQTSRLLPWHSLTLSLEIYFPISFFFIFFLFGTLNAAPFIWSENRQNYPKFPIE